MTARNPIIDPQPGDVIQQKSGLLVRVIARKKNRVAWESRTPKGRWTNKNSWILSAWEGVVCGDATVVSVAEEN